MTKLISFLLLVGLFVPTAAHALTPNDTEYSELWYLDKIGAPAAWDTTVGSSEIVVAVLDAGIDLNHPDLSGNIWKNPGEIADNGIDDDANGYIDDFYGWDFVDSDDDPTPDTGFGADEDAIAHGSLIAGIVGAEGNNGEGVTGVNWQVSIMSLRMLNDVGAGSSTKAASAIRYAVDNGADVINLSFSGSDDDPNLRNAIEEAYEAGVVVVAAMGNEGTDADEIPVYPACYGVNGEEWVIGVAASDIMDAKADFSNFGENCTDITAPGEGIWGVDYHEPLDGFDEKYDGYWNGTSMASPVVAGAAALLLSVYPDLTPDEIANILKLSVDPVKATPEMRGKLGAGRLNINKALEVGASFAESDEEDPEEEEDADEDPEEPATPIGGDAPGSGEFGTSPVDGEEEEISVFDAGDYLSSPSFSTVYFVDEDLNRRTFMDTNTYFTYEDSFDTVWNVTDATLPELKLSGIMLPRPGVVLVKIQSIETVYAVEENPADPFSPILRAIETEEIAIEMYGSDWADFVIDISPTFFTKYTTGEAITEAEEVDTSIMKTRLELAQLAS